MAGRDFTKTRWRAIRTAPCARERVTIMGKNSGVNPTARDETDHVARYEFLARRRIGGSGSLGP